MTGSLVAGDKATNCYELGTEVGSKRLKLAVDKRLLNLLPIPNTTNQIPPGLLKPVQRVLLGQPDVCLCDIFGATNEAQRASKDPLRANKNNPSAELG